MPTTANAQSSARPWWQRPYRMVQTNLRQPDALYDQVKLAQEARDFGADVLLYNIGGIFAFYPTDLRLQAQNPYMKGDALGEAVNAAHDAGLSLVGRFDMSKATRTAYEAHPEWFVHNSAGEPLEYNGTYQACVNGGWYQDYALRIIEESLGRYDVDGVFFNMFGYRNFNYSGAYFGMCVCRNCQRRFREMYGRDLPAEESFNDPAYVDYLEFKDITSRELQAKVYDKIKDVNPKVAMTGHRGKCDLIRLEVQRAVSRPQPEWPYQAGEQARWARAYAPTKTASSTSTNFIDFAWRFASETGAYHMLRFAQQLANGATLDYYLLGVLEQDDKKAFKQVSELFHWHADNSQHYEGLTSAARIGLYHSFKTNTYRDRTDSAAHGQHAFRGAYRMLAEARLPFDFVSDEQVEGQDGAATLARYDAILMPNVACLSDEEAGALDQWVRSGGNLVATGETGFYDSRGSRRDVPALKTLPLNVTPMARPDMKGAYFTIAPGELPVGSTGLLMLDGTYFVCQPSNGSEALLTLLPPQRFGPPELCFPDFDSEQPGALTGREGSGRAVYVPWHPDVYYYRDSLPDIRTFVAHLVSSEITPAPARIVGNGAIELTVQIQEEANKLLVHVINYGGQRNNLYEDPAEAHDLKLGVRGVKGSGKALRTGQIVETSGEADSEGYVWYDLPPVAAFEAISLSRD